MDPEIIDWSSVESVFIEDFVYEHFNAPKWVDLSASDEFVDDEAWFCRPNCKHPKCADDFLKPPRNSKVKMLGSVTISEIFPFKGWNRRNANLTGKENSVSASEEKSNAKDLLKTEVKLHDDSENSNPNVPLPPLSGKGVHGSKRSVMKPMLETNVNDLLKNEEVKPTQFSHGGSENSNPNVSLPPLSGKGIKGSKRFVLQPMLETKEKVVDDLHTDMPRMDRKPKLRNAFSARNLMGGRDILSQLTGFCSELKNLARRKSKKGSSENVAGGDAGEKCRKARTKERAPLLVVKEGTI